MFDFSEAPVDGNYLVKSGLLYLINRDILHPIGLALTVDTKTGMLGLLDKRLHPNFYFEKQVVINGYAKFSKFMEEFGNKQMNHREEILGWAVQPQIYGEK